MRAEKAFQRETSMCKYPQAEGWDVLRSLEKESQYGRSVGNYTELTGDR